MATTLAAIEALLCTALNYEEAGSVSTAKSVITYCNQWLLLKPTGASNEGSNLAFDVNQIRIMRDEARGYISANDTTGGRVSFFTFDRDARR